MPSPTIYIPILVSLLVEYYLEKWRVRLTMQRDLHFQRVTFRIQHATLPRLIIYLTWLDAFDTPQPSHPAPTLQLSWPHVEYQGARVPLVAARDLGADLPRVGEVPAHPAIGELHATRRIVVIGYTAGSRHGYTQAAGRAD